MKWAGIVRRDEWPAWGLLVVVLYAAVAWAGWHRTLIPDEIRPLLLAAGPLQVQVEFARQDLVQTPLSYLVGRGFLHLFGHTDAAAKALVFVVSVATLVLFTSLARQVTPHWRLASLLCVVTYLRVGSALNQARMYGPLLLFVVAALLLWEQWRVSGGLGWLAGWVAAMSCAAYTHGSALLLVPAFVIANWLAGPRRWLFAAASAIPVLALVPWIAYVSGVFAERGIEANVRAIRMDPTRAVAHLPFYFLTGEDPGGGSPLLRLYRDGVSGWLKWAALLPHLALLALGWRGLRPLWPLRREGHRAESWIWTVLVLCAVPLALLYVFSLLMTPVVHARYLLVILPGYWLLLALLWQYGGRASRILIGGVFLWILASAGLAVALHRTPSAARQAAEVVAAELGDGDLILCDKHHPVGWQFYWEWTRRLGGRGDRVAILRSPMAAWLTSIVPGTELDSLNLKRIMRVWFVHGEDRQREALVREFLGTRGFAVDARPGAGPPSLVLFARRGGQPARR